ncbi:MAG: RsmE family RNA methyltransferase [Bacillota bacterium]
MARPNWSNRKHKDPQRSGHPGQRPNPQPHTPVVAGRSDAPGDEPLAIASRLTLQEPFRIGRALVKRLQRREVNPKEAFTIRDESGTYFRAAFKESDTNGGLALPYERMERSPEPTIDITLACAVLARQRMHFVVQKATELGVMRIVPLLTDYSVPLEGLEHEQSHAWPGHIARAAKQCRRGSLPQVLPPTPLDSFLASPVFTTADLCLFLDDRSEPAPVPAGPPQRIVLLVGPEGGFSDAERAKLTGKARPWVLGGRVLRAETAVLVGLTAVHMTWGDFTRV